MNIQDFFTTNNGKGVDFDNYYGDQCVDLVQFYNRDVLNAPLLTGNAVDIWTTYPKDFYTQIPNTPDNFPSLGDVVIWGTGIGQFGHIAVCKEGNKDTFTSFDQNWNGHKYCEFVTHTYASVLGWLRPKITTPKPDLQAELDQCRAERDKNWNLYQADEATIANLNNLTKAKDSQISTLQQQVTDLTTQSQSKDMTIQTLQDQANKVPALQKELDQANNDRTISLNAQEQQNKKIAALEAGKPKGVIKKLIFLFT